MATKKVLRLILFLNLLTVSLCGPWCDPHQQGEPLWRDEQNSPPPLHDRMMREDFNPDVVQNREFNGRSIEDKLDGFFTAESKEGNPFFEHFLYQNDEISDQDSVNLLGVNDDQDFLARDGQQMENGTCVSDIICDESTKEYRSFDGSCNNLDNPAWGKSGIPYRRLAHRKFSLMDCGEFGRDPRQLFLPNPRRASRVLTQRSEQPIAHPDRHDVLSMWVMTFGQAVDHDVQRTPQGEFRDCCSPENEDHIDCCQIDIPRRDFFYGKNGRTTCLSFIRSRRIQHPGIECNKMPDVENANTAWIDLSFVYGSDEEKVMNLRTGSGDGKLKTSKRSGRVFPMTQMKDGKRKMRFGDARGNVHPAQTMICTIFIKNHNDIAENLAKIHPEMNDEKIYQEAKKINTAVFQNIVYTQFMDALLGKSNELSLNDSIEGNQDFYNPKVDGSIRLDFSTAAYRLHTFISDRFVFRDQDYKITQSLLLRHIFKEDLLITSKDNMDDLIRGHTAQSLQEFNAIYANEMAEWMFAAGKDWGLDIVSLNIQRGRDHQIQGYPFYKKMCGLGNTEKWDDLKDLIPEKAVHDLQHAYKNPGDIDFYIGGTLETVKEGHTVGPTWECLITHQFRDLKEGDRYFFTNPGQFTENQLKTIRKQTLSSVICSNSNDVDKMRLPENIFEKVDGPELLKNCDSFPKLDFSQW